MAEALCSPHVQLTFRFRQVKGGCSKRQKPREEAGKVLKFPSELTVFEVGDVEKMPCGGKKKEVSYYARSGFENCRCLQ
jgi:hypothetical protein